MPCAPPPTVASYICTIPSSTAGRPSTHISLFFRTLSTAATVPASPDGTTPTAVLCPRYSTTASGPITVPRKAECRRIKPFSAIPSPHSALMGVLSCTSSTGANGRSLPIRPMPKPISTTTANFSPPPTPCSTTAQRISSSCTCPSPTRLASTTATPINSPPAHPPTSTTSPWPTPTSPTFALSSNNVANGTPPPSSSWEITPGAPRP